MNFLLGATGLFSRGFWLLVSGRVCQSFIYLFLFLVSLKVIGIGDIHFDLYFLVSSTPTRN